jgi:hypothetical protein
MAWSCFGSTQKTAGSNGWFSRPLGPRKFEEAMQLWRKAQGRFEQAFGSARAAELRSELKFVTSEAFKDAF